VPAAGDQPSDQRRPERRGPEQGSLDPVIDDHDRGLRHDLSHLLDRRRALLVLGGSGLVASLAACGSPATTVSPATTASAAGAGASGAATVGGSNPSTTVSSSTAASGATGSGTSSPADAPADGSCSVIPQETAGPFPGDGSNGKNVLNQSGVVRRDIVRSFGSASGVAAGVPMTIALRVLSTAKGCAPLAGAAVYVWHCDQQGRYSMYSSGATGENYLRGVQETDADERDLTSTFPAAYDGRWAHVHFEVYPDLAQAVRSGTRLRTSQLALPKDACDEVFATDGYERSVANLARTSLGTDMVFRDGYSLQLASVEGSAANGMTASLTVPV
jgi:protocatechuate 3,4-dioxygenase beta subunit